MINSLRLRLERYADQIGFTGSLFCLIHCILTSGVIIFTSALSHAHEGHDHAHSHTMDFFGVLDISMVLIGGIAVYFASRKSCIRWMKVGMWMSYLVYATTMLVKYAGFEPMWLAVISYSASFSLIALHFMNMKKTHGKDHSCDSELCVVKSN
ncbi:MerC domain-containing protein [Flammeovirga yaeyamensis]|uniref:MerC domain-containing protein n=1 Tax=Flammeovirga yaeyamensis TaxID=367791 RepID=A0AAX1N6N6_9BACT|nr:MULTISPECIES: MerC domain-containing protein [Flammeovirga]ANQ50904.1 MerC domain-containing protein [Flammeovirga sp. MY04]MBB3701221.1 hypothetical protein [Flammeovirga yaeyamensis]NMF38453.1 MerC domain-containing protein [Flammeovirga yaeyamensis]QWG01687.1 MerC domain-containing protein [Flammeovirga yaeyamensis]